MTTVVITTGRIILRFFLHALTTIRVLVIGDGNNVMGIMMSVRQDPGMTLVGRVVEGGRRPARRCARARGEDASRALSGASIFLPRSRRGERPLLARRSLNVYRNLQDDVHIAMVPQVLRTDQLAVAPWTDLSGLPFLEIRK